MENRCTRCNMPFSLMSVLQSLPRATAFIKGSRDYPHIEGLVKFYETKKGTLVHAEINGLPKSFGRCGGRIFGFHIHTGEICSGNEEDPFADVMGHYNPHDCEHPFHAGDLPPLFGNDGFALSIFLSDRFTVNDIIGRTVIIHDMPDDFTTQPAGNSGTKIACGEIRATLRR